MKTRIIAILMNLTLSASLMTTLCSCRRTAEADDPNEPYLAEDMSYFNDFKIVDDTVVFSCYLTLFNPESNSVTVEVIGDFTIDFMRGLITENPLPAFSTDDPPISDFVLKPGENKLYVLFAAPHGSLDEKFDRLLPKIEIVRVDQQG